MKYRGNNHFLIQVIYNQWLILYAINQQYFICGIFYKADLDPEPNRLEKKDTRHLERTDQI